MKRRRRRSRPTLSLETAQLAYAAWTDGGTRPLLCVCGCGEPAREWHHVFDQGDYRELVDVLANVVPVAPRCHSRHTNAVERFPRSICAQAEALAVSPAMEDYLDRFYRAA